MSALILGGQAKADLASWPHLLVGSLHKVSRYAGKTTFSVMLALVGVALLAAIAALGYVAERHQGVSTSWATLEEFGVNRDWMSKPEPQLVVIAGTVVRVRVRVRVWRRSCSVVQLVLSQRVSARA
jgi:hypothetical protein